MRKVFHNTLIFQYAIVVILFMGSWISCTKNSEEGKEKIEEEHTDEHAEGPHEKMVRLNIAQVSNAGIDTGWFELKNLSEVINANGYTKLPPQNQAEVSVQLKGTIQSIKVIEGQPVKRGQVLATMQSMEYNNMRLERARLSESLKTSEANLEFLRQEYARQKELSEENVTSQKVFQKVSADLKAEESRISGLKNQISILGQNIQIGGNSASPVINIVAPISGNVTEIDVSIGSSVESGNPLFHIVDNTKMHVDLLVYEKDLFKVKSGQHVRFILTNQNNEELNGKIFSIGKSFENDTKSVAVHAEIENNNPGLIPGMYVNALIDIGSSQVNALPVDAIIKAEGKEFIFVWEGDSHMEEEGHAHTEEEEDHAHEAGESHDHAEGETHEHSESEEHTGESGSHEPHEEEIAFARIEVKTGASQLGYVQVTPLVEIHKGDKIVIKGAYYLQSHLLKSEGGGGHAH